ncbi:MAG TPA: trypsin-like peptidase domain-containing protein [Peptococcaceae bacterium]|nr:trypsin-like peptidase domain-containing protein [Peptococcaceae bacterium]HPZ70901.1 trypsin-like peptidase domain-containing protein [Peptococcaceae bacterium]HQD54503.1 trypsin-like peptidase domain-containing protein [Peptococcaceae bacterium]
MRRLRVNKLLVLYTLLVFLGGMFSAAFYLTIKGYNVPWNPAPAQEQTDANGQVVPASMNTFIESGAIDQIVEKCGPAVVMIETVTKEPRSSRYFRTPFDDPFFRDFFDGFRFEPELRERQGMGSGFIISKDGYILTNNHVIEGASEINVTLTTRKEAYKAKVIGTDEELDLAVIKIDAGNNLPLLKLGDSNKVKVGNWVIAIGNPFGLDHTVTVGVISAKGRPVAIEGKEFKDLLQTDASINPGNSGGPLLNLQGEVIGINTAINAEAQGIGFAISSSSVQQVLEDLMEKGKVVRPWLGVYMQPVTEELADYFGLDKPQGVLISAIQNDSPAEKAGLERGDIILEYNKQPVQEPEELQKLVRESKIGDKAILLIHRQDKTMYVTVTIEEKK